MLYYLVTVKGPGDTNSSWGCEVHLPGQWETENGAHYETAGSYKQYLTITKQILI